MNKNFTLIIALAIFGLLIIGAVIYSNQTGSGNNPQALSSQEVSEKVINFINQEILRGQSTASLVETLEENGLYKIKFVIEGQDMEIDVYASLDGELFFPDVIDFTEVEKTEAVVEETTTVGGFSVSNDEVCKENDKPIIYFFGSEKCSFCLWEHPIVEMVAEKFGGEISFHNNMDSDDDKEVFQKYSTGGIPTMVFGCKYYKVGAGQSDGEEGEARNLTALICKLTGNKPADVCSEVQDLVNQIET